VYPQAGVNGRLELGLVYEIRNLRLAHLLQLHMGMKRDIA